MTHQAYIEMLQPARIRERKKVMWRSLKKKYQKEKQLQDQNIYENVKFNENILTDLVVKSNKIFKRLTDFRKRA